MTNTFIQIHTLTGYQGVLLNRDDSGMAKRIEYGDSVRTRTSSQFAKRKIRLADGAASIASLGEMSVRSRLTFRALIAEPLVEEGNPADLVVAATLAVMDAILGKSKKAEEKRAKAKDKKGDVGSVDPFAVLERGELIILGEAEISYVKSTVRDIVSEAVDLNDVEKRVAALIKDHAIKSNLAEIGKNNRSLDVAMFGRMVTGDVLSAVDAAVHVAHAMTVHTQASEVDFFTAVDDLKSAGDEHGSAHMGEVEITSPLLYGYYVVDFNQLLGNLKGLDNAREIASRMVANLVQLVSTQIVGAKKGSTAPYSTADFVMVEIGSAANRTLAEAFRRPVRPTVDAAVDALATYVSGKDAMYGSAADHRYVASIVPAKIAESQSVNVPAMLKAIEAVLQG